MSEAMNVHSGVDAAHAVHHDDHGHGHHEQSFISKYIFSMDHKTIGKQFLITGMVWAIIGGLFSVLFRLQLGYPDQSFPILETFFGNWAKGGQIQPEFYYGLVTMHGTVLVFFVLTAGLSGTFANLLIPLQIGARDMASPFLNMLSYWFFFIAGIVMLASIFVHTGPASGGWTMYPPLSALRQAGDGQKIGTDLWLISMALFIVSSLLGGLNYISTILNMRTKGMSMTRLPLPIWAMFFTAVLGVLSFPVLLSGAILLLFDRNLGTSFYLSDIVINGEILPNEGGSAILYQHLFWFLGHPEVYIILLPAMGMVSEILSVNARKPIFGYMAMLGSLFAIAILAFLVWAHHMFVTGLNPFLGSVFVLLTLLIAVPSAIKVFNWLTTLWRGNIRFTPATLFAIGFVSLFISGGLTGIFLGNSTIDIHLHDTMFVVAHFHIVMGVASFFGMFAGVYHWFPKMFGRYLNNTLGYMHFWVTMIGAYLIFWPMHYQGLAGIPRRYLDKSGWVSFNQFGELDKMITIVSIIVFAVQLMFVFNFFYSIFKGRKVTTPNPWGANTLEWTTKINPGHGNWEGEIPEVHRWPYDYSKDGRDFIPQTEPIGANESKH
ncbi:MAG: cbb3-type cytochrome c oxidase subunit I [Chitinophagaceae bacterium]|nr:cbb3-type cytochrome c oxidase subunit I [Chitinophagaceae bacterium]MBK9381016.1 cbb3-type cytochrome c oxidase subunit I [Chitinophagaceae bacterium]MBL0306539.1 cbb3-type cytochrome c oxidase subunit I [Chitinophagaceae bacterium]HQV61050.1 cbb3-type cytochrome c oxidase subunit I [Chitinophagaceae bacterium]